MDTKTPTNGPTSYHPQRAPRTPESYFNVPESIALLNIVKSERIQSAFQSNRKNHASVWEMVAEILNRFSARKRSAKQCCNRYENLKKIYTQLKKNPEKHVRRNWPYMFLFKEIEEQRGECWGANGKRITLMPKDHSGLAAAHTKELTFYHRRRQAELSLLLSKDVAAVAAVQSNLLNGLANSNSSQSNSNNSKMDRFLPNHFVETQMNDVSNTNGNGNSNGSGNGIGNSNGNGSGSGITGNGNSSGITVGIGMCNGNGNGSINDLYDSNNLLSMQNMSRTDDCTNGLTNGINVSQDLGDDLKDAAMATEYEKDCNGALNLQTTDNHIAMKSEPLSDGEFNPDDIQLMQTNYNSSHSFYPHGIDPNILNPDVIVDTDNISDCSSISLKSKRKLSTSTDGDSTNYELIEYLKRRERRDEDMLKRMNDREERLLNLLERTVLAIENLANNRNKVA